MNSRLHEDVRFPSLARKIPSFRVLRPMTLKYTHSIIIPYHYRRVHREPGHATKNPFNANEVICSPVFFVCHRLRDAENLIKEEVTGEINLHKRNARLLVTIYAFTFKTTFCILILF